MSLLEDFLAARSIPEVGEILQHFHNELSKLSYRGIAYRLEDEYGALTRHIGFAMDFQRRNGKKIWNVCSAADSVQNYCSRIIPQIGRPLETFIAIRDVAEGMRKMVKTGLPMLSEEDVYGVLGNLHSRYKLYEITKKQKFIANINRIDAEYVHKDRTWMNGILLGDPGDEYGNLPVYDLMIFPNTHGNNYYPLFRMIAQVLMFVQPVDIPERIFRSLGFTDTYPTYNERMDILADVIATGLMNDCNYLQYSKYRETAKYDVWCFFTDMFMETLIADSE